MNRTQTDPGVRDRRPVSGFLQGMARRHLILPLSLFCLGPGERGSAHATTITFGDVVLDESYPGPGGGSYYNGSTASLGVGDWDGSFLSGGALFANTFSEIDFGGATFTTWEGFAVSNTTDTQTAGFQNQYSAWTAGPPAGAMDGNHAIGFGQATVDFGGPVSVGEISLANTTYTALSMRFGDPFARAFGDDPSTTIVETNFPSWFLLTISGSLGGTATGSDIEFYLADYRFADDTLDYIVDDWVTSDLAPLGSIDRLHFVLTSSDTGPFGINTPAYVALDQISYTPLPVPEPGSAALLSVLSLSLLLAITRRRHS